MKLHVVIATPWCGTQSRVELSLLDFIGTPCKGQFLSQWLFRKNLVRELLRMESALLIRLFQELITLWLWLQMVMYGPGEMQRVAKSDDSLNHRRTNTSRPWKFCKLELKKKKRQSIFFAVDTLLFTRTRKANYSLGDSITMVSWVLAIK